MLKIKIGLTAIVLYEIIAVIFMHMANTCNTVFGNGFCADSPFKYFVICVAIPLIGLICTIWVKEIIARRRRKHSVLGYAKHVIKDVALIVRDRVAERVSTVDLEKMMMAALIFGIKKYADKHPRVRDSFEQMFTGDNCYEQYFDDEIDDNKWDLYSNENNSVKHHQKKQTKKK